MLKNVLLFFDPLKSLISEKKKKPKQIIRISKMDADLSGKVFESDVANASFYKSSCDLCCSMMSL